MNQRNFINIKIRYGFVILCLAITLCFIVSAFIGGIYATPIMIAISFIILKCKLKFLISLVTITFLIYRKIKYRDDGRELVTGWQFLNNHVSFAVINAWCSYQMYYSFVNSLEVLCEPSFSYVSNDTTSPFDYCHLVGTKIDTYEFPLTLYYYTMLPNVCKVCYLLIFIEMVINLAYWKDIIFSSAVLLIFGGMLALAYRMKYD